MRRNDTDIFECYCHAVLVRENKFKPALRSDDMRLRQLLSRCGSFYNILREEFGLMFEQVLSEERHQHILTKIQNLPTGFRTFRVYDSEFPTHLRDIPHPTPVLYTVGDLELLNSKTIGVVGTRRIERKPDIDAANSCLARLIKREYTIVSGLASGCDTLAHRFAVENGGKTIAVLGTRLDRYYPKENSKLQNQIAENHLLVSQYPVGIETSGACFAHRNTTTVGLSEEGLVVLLSPDKSGTLHAVRECVETKKQLYVLKHNLDRGFQWVEEYRGNYRSVSSRPHNQM